MRMTQRWVAAVTALLVGAIAAPAPARADTATLTPIEHFVYLMQGERSFDNYFGTFPGADGPPPRTCLKLSLTRPGSRCVRPFALHGTPAGSLAASQSVLTRQIDNGRMDGFVSAFQRQGRDGAWAMGYYDERDLGFYWALAHQYVLFDRFFASASYGIRLNRSYWVAAAPPPGRAGGDTIFDRLQAAGVSWKFYVQAYDPRATFRAGPPGAPPAQTARVPLLNYARFIDDPALRSHIVDLDEYYQDLQRGTLPAVSYVATSGWSERAARSIPAGQRLVRSMITQLMASSAWSRSAFLWSYDGTGGWYDHVAPPVIDGQPAGLRVPALLISPYARRGVVEHTQLDYTGALRFIEENWGLTALTSRDAQAGRISGAFDFASRARAARIVPAADTGSVPPVDIRVIYVGYGAALLLGLGLIAHAVAGARRAGRRPRPGVEVGRS